MSKADYEESKQLELIFVTRDCTDVALLMGCMRRASIDTQVRLRNAFPDIWYELVQRHNAPGGYLSHEAHPFMQNIVDNIFCALCGKESNRTPLHDE